MAEVFKIALPGYNAATDTDPNHFALFVDQNVDYILIKEKLVFSQLVNAHASPTVAHGLGYVPLCFVFAQVSAGVWRKLYSAALDGTGFYFLIDATNLTLVNNTGAAVQFAYHIFYDNIT